MTVWLIRFSESSDRPEQFIANRLARAFLQAFEGNLEHFKDFEIGEAAPTFLQEKFYSTENLIRSFGSVIDNLLSEIQNGDTLFFVDAFSPLVPFIRYYSAFEGKRLKLCGIFHSSSNIVGDMFFDDYEMRKLEQYLVSTLDEIYVASNYMSQALNDYDTIHVTGLPIMQKGWSWYKKENSLGQKQMVVKIE